MNNLKVTFFLAGVPKGASSWTAMALSEHPEIFMPDIKPVSFFNIKFEQGFDWYRTVFADHNDEPAIGDASPDYMKSRQAPRRIAARVPDAKLVFIIRNPMERAFSQWWHGNRSGWTNIDFEDVFRSHHAWDLLVEPGFYAMHLERWAEYFDEEQMLVKLFDDFQDNNEGFIQQIYEFVGVDSDFRPSIVGEKKNVGAEMRGPPTYETVKAWFRHTMPPAVTEITKPVYNHFKWVIESESAYKRGMDGEVRKHLELVYSDDVADLEERLDLNLAHWFRYLKPGQHYDSVLFEPAYRQRAPNWNTKENIRKNYRIRRS